MKSLAIEREFGSGGREIGIMVAQKAGIPYYDGELIKKAARLKGYRAACWKNLMRNTAAVFCMILRRI